MQDLHQLITGNDGPRGIDLEHHVLIVAFFLFILRQHRDSAESGEFFRVLFVMAAIDCNKLAHALQVRQSHRSGDFTHLAVGTHARDLVVAGEAEVLHQSCCLCQLVIVGDNGPTFK